MHRRHNRYRHNHRSQRNPVGHQHLDADDDDDDVDCFAIDYCSDDCYSNSDHDEFVCVVAVSFGKDSLYVGSTQISIMFEVLTKTYGPGSDEEETDDDDDEDEDDELDADWTMDAGSCSLPTLTSLPAY